MNSSDKRDTWLTRIGYFTILALSATLFTSGGAAQEKPAPVRPLVSERNFESWVFQRQGGAKKAREQVQAMVDRHLAMINSVCTLSEIQNEKLELCGSGDVSRFFEDYERLKQKYVGMPQNDPRFQQLFQEIQPLQMRVQTGLIDRNSLLLKSVRNTLTDEQYGQYDTLVRERRAYRHMASIRSAVAILEQTVPLRSAQRKELIQILKESTKPITTSSQYDYYVHLYNISQIPEEKMRLVINDAQWNAMQQLLQQGRAMEQFLKQQGLFPEQEDEEEL